jgi:hypothetical protein
MAATTNVGPGQRGRRGLRLDGQQEETLSWPVARLSGMKRAASCRQSLPTSCSDDGSLPTDSAESPEIVWTSLQSRGLSVTYSMPDATPITYSRNA